MIDENQGFDCPATYTTGGYFALPPEEKIIELKGGMKLTASEAKSALDEAMTIIEAVGTTGIYSRVQSAERWMKAFYPNGA